MQFRFRKYNEDNDTYKLLGYCQIESYAEAFKLFQYMKEEDLDLPVMINTEDTVEKDGEYYRVIGVYFVAPISGGETIEHIAVDLEEAF